MACNGGDSKPDVSGGDLPIDTVADPGVDLGNTPDPGESLDLKDSLEVGTDKDSGQASDPGADLQNTPDVDSGAEPDITKDKGVEPDLSQDILSDPGCVPDCSSAMCGSDGCGGSCGTCVEGAVCTEAQSCVTQIGGLCPPTSTGLGTGVGDTIGEVVLSDCDGNLYSVQQLCPKKASWLYVYAGWCAPCQEHMTWASFWYTGYSEYDFEAYVVITDGPNFETVTPAYCQQIKANFNLSMPVLMDPKEQVTALVGTDGSDVNIILGQGAEIKYVGSNPLEFKATLDSVLEIEE